MINQKTREDIEGRPAKRLKKGDEVPPAGDKISSSPKKRKLPDATKNPKKKSTGLTEKPANWNDFKQKKKELRLKRRQNKNGFDVIVKAKKIGEKLRCKTLSGGEVERNKLINELHAMLKENDHYTKFVLAHDTSRVVQWLLKYGSDIVKKQISKVLLPTIIEMIQSKYGVFCVKRLLKYGDHDVRSDIIDKLCGHAVKLTTHTVSASVFEYAYSTWATSQQKQYLTQEFFGDIYRNSKDKSIKHLQDVFDQSPDLKAATLGATKSNLMKVINKTLLDSMLVQTVLNQYLSTCAPDDRTEMISILIPHIVVISNSKDGARAAMQCIWHGSNKDRKLAMKTIKEHVLELSKHEHGHCTIITLLDAADDTVLLHKLILSEILKGAKDLAVNEWGRKVLLWLVAPSDSTCFHPIFIKELDDGRANSNSKKEPEIRRKEILERSIETLLELICEDPKFWLSSSSVAHEVGLILKAGKGPPLQKVYESIVKVIVDPEWKIKQNDIEVLGIEDAGIHMILKKIAKNDALIADSTCTFGNCLANSLQDGVVENWILVNRGCFLLVAVYENNCDAVKEKITSILNEHRKLLKKQKSAGSRILLEKMKQEKTKE